MISYCYNQFLNQDWISGGGSRSRCCCKYSYRRSKMPEYRSTIAYERTSMIDRWDD